MSVFKKIDSFIQQHKIFPCDCIYHTHRDIKNSAGQLTGKIRILVWKADSRARCEYVCPECKKYGYQETEWKRPFSIKCEHCNFLIRTPKMRDEFRREQKTARKK